MDARGQVYMITDEDEDDKTLIEDRARFLQAQIEEGREREEKRQHDMRDELQRLIFKHPPNG